MAVSMVLLVLVFVGIQIIKIEKKTSISNIKNTDSVATTQINSDKITQTTSNQYDENKRQNINPVSKIISNTNWENPNIRKIVFCPFKDIDFLVAENKHNLSELIKSANIIFYSFSNCMRKKTCHKNISSSLKILNKAMKTVFIGIGHDRNLKSRLNKNEILNFFEIENHNTRLLSADIIFKIGNRNTILEIFERTRELPDNEFVSIMSIFSRYKKMTRLLNKKRNNLLFDRLTNGTINTISKILKKLETFHLSPSVLKKAFKTICSKKRKKKNSDSWIMIEYRMENIFHNRKIKFKNICNH